ncbi:hypothetical protein HHI36_000390 [Cryptolaemus montrouzieri]|uniref:BTB domain-containing protein n=1 Tax=Cryptolaemus montrouzieri TaxID=559131 RepID=A0ABD2P4V9_9CUCU
MNKTQVLYRDCTENCRSVSHGDVISAAITKRCISDLELCSYLNYICTNCESVKDSVGRTALHLAASCGRIELVRWLVKIRNANINLKDEESGYTPLHRSLFYGKIHVAVELMKLGANSSIYDMDSLTAVEHVTKDGHKPLDCYSGNLYTWGLNNNNSLGSFSSRTIPESLDIFHKRYPEARVQQVCIDKFHSLIISTDGDAYSCGHGLGGRLGLGTEQTVVVPTKIDFQSSEKLYVLKASIARDHCLFLTYDGRGDTVLYSCGSNKYKVLGLSPAPEKVLIPRKIKKTFQQSVDGISTGRFHSAVWTSSALYTWGLNAGQLGHEPISGNYFVNVPKQVKVINAENCSIKQVASSDGAIAIMNVKGDIYVLHEYQCRKIASKLLNVVDIAVIGGNLNTSSDKDLKNELAKELKVLVRTNVGNLLLWQESDQQLCRCIFSIPRTIVVHQMTININEVLFVTDFGEAFRGVIKPRKKKTLLEKKNAFHNFLVREECVTIKLSKFPRIHRGISIVSDPRGEDYCVIQASPYNQDLHQDIPPTGDLKKCLSVLLEDANEEDNIHDVQIKIGSNVFPAHKYVLAHSSQILQNLFQDESELILKDVNVDLFEQMLLFMYTGDCDLLLVGKCPERFRKYCAGYSDSKENEDNLSTNNKNEKKRNPSKIL